MTSLSRRIVLGILAAGSAVFSNRILRSAVARSTGNADEFHGFSGNTNDRVWLGAEFWANPMEDWRIVDGGAECKSAGVDRNVHLLTHQLTNAGAAFRMSVSMAMVEIGAVDGGAGFRLGVRSDLNEYRSNCFAASGINAGVAYGHLLLDQTRTKLAAGDKGEHLVLEGQPQGDGVLLTLASVNSDGSVLTSLNLEVAAADVLGNVAIVNHFGNAKKGGGTPTKQNDGPRGKQQNGSRCRFRNWKVSGDAFTVNVAQKFGPILWSMYSLSDSRSSEGFVMKMSALTPPLGTNDEKSVELQVRRGGEWKSLGHQILDPDAWVATFRVSEWNQNQAHEYQLIYRESHPDRTVTTSAWSGTVQANPAGRPLRLAALTCQNDYAFPYEPVVSNLARLAPDMLYFSGDQIYESHGGYGIIRDPAESAILNYLRKFYMFGWAFRDVIRDRPTICIPDDHDVFQGNLWGEGGAPMEGIENGASSKGGYREPARMVNAVHRTCVGHHPDFFDPAPSLQNISVYHGDMVFGNVSFAILADRQFKSGPTRVNTGSGGRADHVTDPQLDTRTLDAPGLILLGERQEAFLEHWGSDWRGHDMKVLLSQTVFAAVATHHGGYNGYLRADLDSGGWPQTPRNRAIRILKKSMPLHINGDQHLTSLVQYGVDQQRDGCWSFCTPAIAVGYPRWWRPDELPDMPHQNRPQHGLPQTGEYLDGFGNKAYVYAIGNPEQGTDKSNRYRLAHQKGSGFGMVTIDTVARTYKIESFRFLVDVTDGNPGNQFPGWPVVLHQAENRGENRIR